MTNVDCLIAQGMLIILILLIISHTVSKIRSEARREDL